jgi:Cysteine-rich CPXCG
MLEEIPAACPHCGEPVELTVDRSGGALQEYVEDCPVCCRPWQVLVRIDEYGDCEVALKAQ